MNVIEEGLRMSESSCPELLVRYSIIYGLWSIWCIEKGTYVKYRNNIKVSKLRIVKFVKFLYRYN